jgi:hypothetical protein
MSRDYLLYTILSISAAHRQSFAPSPQNQNTAMLYRQKTFNAYNEALQNITTDNYETLLITSLLMQLLVPPPELPCTDRAILEWLTTFLVMTQGLRILAGLKWASGIEKLFVFPIFKRELRTLPPPPLIRVPSEDPRMFAREGPMGETPEHPNPPAMYRDGGDQVPRPVSAGVDSTSCSLLSPLAEPSEHFGNLMQSYFEDKRIKSFNRNVHLTTFLSPTLCFVV